MKKYSTPSEIDLMAGYKKVHNAAANALKKAIETIKFIDKVEMKYVERGPREVYVIKADGYTQSDLYAKAEVALDLKLNDNIVTIYAERPDWGNGQHEVATMKFGTKLPMRNILKKVLEIYS